MDKKSFDWEMFVNFAVDRPNAQMLLAAEYPVDGQHELACKYDREENSIAKVDLGPGGLF
jgi:hypothetical protein